MTLKRINGETECAACGRPAYWQIIAQRPKGNLEFIATSVMVLCDRDLGALRSLMQWRHWDASAASDGKIPFKPHGRV